MRVDNVQPRVRPSAVAATPNDKLGADGDGRVPNERIWWRAVHRRPHPRLRCRVKNVEIVIRNAETRSAKEEEARADKSERVTYARRRLATSVRWRKPGNVN